MKLVLIRGIPGSGKSTIAKTHFVPKGYRHYEADMYFEIGGVYRFNPEKVQNAHGWCQKMTQDSLLMGMNVVVTNTFVRLWELEGYLHIANKLNAAVRIIQATGCWNNVHGVSDDIITRMKENWETIANTELWGEQQ